MSRPELPIPQAQALWTNQAMIDDTDSGVYTSRSIVNTQGYSGIIFRYIADTEVGTATFDMKVQAYLTADDDWYDIAGASITQVTANMSVPLDLIISPSITAVANRAVAQPVHRTMRVIATVAESTTEGFTVSVEYEWFNA
jgi:hypothetical protein